MLGPGHTPHTVIAAEPGYEVLVMEYKDVLRFPVVAWNIIAGGLGGVCPITIGYTAYRDEMGVAVSLPDGRVITLETEPRLYKDVETWRTSVNCRAWSMAGQFTAGEA